MDKLFRISNSLNKEEISSFLKYLDSPFFSVPDFIKEFGIRWFRLCEVSDWKPLDKVVAWRGIYGDKPFQDGFWRKRKSELTSLLEDFMLINHFMSREYNFNKEALHLKQLFNRDLADLFELRFRRIFKDVVSKKYISEDDIVDRIEVLSIGYNFWLSRQDPNKPIAFEAELLEIREGMIEDLYRLRKLKLDCTLINRQVMGSILPSDSYLSEIRSNDSKSRKQPLFRLYKLLQNYLSVQEDQLFEDFVIALKRYYESVNRHERISLFLYAINISTRQYIRKREKKYAEVLFSIYKLGLETDSLTNDIGRLVPGHFKNICSVSNHLKNWEYTRDFIRRYESHLSSGEREENIAEYCRSNLAFVQSKFKESLAIIRAVKKEGMLKSGVRSLEMKVLFELKMYDELEYAIANFERWLQRSNLQDDLKDLHLGRLRILRRIIGLKPGDLEERKSIQNLIKEGNIHDGEWLLQKLREEK